MLPVSLEYPFLISPSVFSLVYLLEFPLFVLLLLFNRCIDMCKSYFSIQCSILPIHNCGNHVIKFVNDLRNFEDLFW
jgi:hypothetical protein